MEDAGALIAIVWGACIFGFLALAVGGPLPRRCKGPHHWERLEDGSLICTRCRRPPHV